MEDLKRCLGDPQMGTWLVAADIMRPEPDELSAVDRLADGMEKIRATDLDALPVVDENRTYVGMLELRAVQRTISREVIRRRQAADPGSQPAETAV
jgi:CBS-domain-containing membrane protein